MAETSELLNGVVEGVTTFGAFVKLEDGRKGLVHISEVARGYVKDINEHLAVGDEVTVKLLDEDENGGFAFPFGRHCRQNRQGKAKQSLKTR